MRVLVTGGNGYVGRSLTRLLYKDHEVAVIDNLRSGRLRLSPEDLNHIRLYQTDLRTYDGVAAALTEFRPDAIVHLAAIHFIPECEQHPGDAIATNVAGTVNLLQACAPGTRFIFASSAAVYAPDEVPHREDRSMVGPIDVYGLTKLQAEEYIRYWSELKQLNSVIVRLFNVIGPGETNPHVVPVIMAQALQGRSTLALGNCYPRRDYVDVRDATAGFSAVLHAPVNGELVDVVNLGTGRAYSVHDVVEELGRVTGRTYSIETNHNRVRTSDRPFLAADTTKIQQRYQWSANLDLRSSLEALWLDPDLPQELLVSPAT